MKKNTKKKEYNFGKKKAKKNGKKNTWEKLKAEFSTISILKNKFDKDSFEKKNMCGSTVAK
jgi:hypothetical protein